MNAKIPQRLPAVELDCMAYLAQINLDQQFHFVLQLGGRLEADYMRQAVRLAMDAEPVFGCRYVAAPRRLSEG